MAVSYHERVGKAMESLRQGLGPFVEREVRERVNKGILQMRAVQKHAGDPRAAEKPLSQWDAAALLKVMWDVWNEVFRFTLGRTERSLVQELRDWRNKWAHRSGSRPMTPTEHWTRRPVCSRRYRHPRRWRWKSRKRNCSDNGTTSSSATRRSWRGVRWWQERRPGR